MELCELCGKAQSIGLASVEGVDLQVCSNCSKYGIRKDQRSNQPRKILHRIEPVFHLTANYAALIRTMREKRKMSQQEFAGYLKERESAVAKWEQGQMQPSIETAPKLERYSLRTCCWC